MNHTILEIFLYGCSSSPNGNQTRASILGGLRLFRSTMGLSYYPSFPPIILLKLDRDYFEDVVFVH